MEVGLRERECKILSPSEMCLLVCSFATDSDAMSMAFHLAEQDFWDKRKQTWEDSLRSLYSMFRVKQCETFYGTCLELDIV